jgi:membrane peptidoglycan carboxypeptidase
MTSQYLHRPSAWKHRRFATLRKIIKKIDLKNLFLLFISFGLIGIIGVLGLFVYYGRDLPNPNSLADRAISQSTKIYDRTGEHLLYEIHGNENRTLVKLSTHFCNNETVNPDINPNGIPLISIQASIAAEDRGFCDHHGFSIKGIIRAAINQLFGGVGGGSTITQQLVKQTVLTSEKSLARKIKELILSIEIERKYSKDEILQMYLNENGFGSTNYGIEAAAEHYFKKQVKDVTLSEAAVLAALPQRPTTLLNNPDLLEARRDWILDGMQEMGFVTSEQVVVAKAEEIIIQNAVADNGIVAPHFVFYVKQLLEEQFKLDPQLIEAGGLKITTTLDYDKQEIAEAEIKNGVENRGKKYSFNNAALVAEDTKTGQILAMVGSKDYFDEEIDGQVNVATSLRQPGSSFKPIVYTAGFIKGYTPNTILWDVNTDFPTAAGNYQPKDYDSDERGPLTVRKALQGSLNIPAVKMLYLVGVENALKFAENLDYTTFSDRSRFGLAIVLGGAEVKLIEHVNAFATIANEGVKNNQTAVLKIEDNDGNIIYEWKEDVGKKIIDQNYTRMISDVLSDNTSRSYIFGENNYLHLDDRPVAAKTGTTNDYNDAWTVGYTPSLAVGVWVGNTNGSDMARGADGSIVAAPIWHAFMSQALSGQPVEQFTPPEIPTTGKAVLDGQISSQILTIDKASGKIATEYTPTSYKETKNFVEYHDILYYINKDDPTGPALADPTTDPYFSPWESAVQSWISRQENETGIKIEQNSAPTDFDDLHIPKNFPSITIESPSKGQTIENQELHIAANATAPRGISRVEFFIDGYYLESDRFAPYEISINLPKTIENGYHTIKAVAFDDIDNSDSDSIGIKINNETSAPDFSIIDPTNGQSIERTQDIYTIAISLQNPENFNFVSIYTKDKLGTSEKFLIKIISSPESPFITIPWTMPESGDWIISAHAEGPKEDLDTLGITVTITPPPNSPSITTTDLNLFNL